MAIGSAWPFTDEPNAEIRGRDLVTGLPKTVIISAAEVREAIEESVQGVVDAIKFCLDKTPPELAADVMDRGVVITGGGALVAWSSTFESPMRPELRLSPPTALCIRWWSARVAVWRTSTCSRSS